MKTTKLFIPEFPLPEGFGNADKYLETLVLQGAQLRYPEAKQRQEIRERIAYELDVIKTLGCADYFLVMWDAVQHAKEEGILIGPGRGSAASSIVNHCLGITHVDPLKYGLLFERFLNTKFFYPCPDIDIDSDGRLYKEMLCYLPERYGRNHVARIANHLCGIVISPEDITKHFTTTTDINCKGDTVLTIEAKAKDVEEAGFLKFDFLTPGYLTIIRDTLNLVKSKCGIDIDLSNIPLDDDDTLQLFQSGKTETIFQFNSEKMRYYLQQMPSITFTDLVTLNSLYSHGFLDLIPDFIACKRGEKRIEQPIPDMEALLSETCGLTVYQEQLEQVAQLLTGFTPNDRYKLRKSLQMKRVDRPRQKEKFFHAATARGYRRDAIESLWQEWDTKACYLFNKSHAVCYTLIAFQTAYLKAHFEKEYMEAIRHNDQGEPCSNHMQ